MPSHRRSAARHRRAPVTFAFVALIALYTITDSAFAQLSGYSNEVSIAGDGILIEYAGSVSHTETIHMGGSKEDSEPVLISDTQFNSTYLLSSIDTFAFARARAGNLGVDINGNLATSSTTDPSNPWKTAVGNLDGVKARATWSDAFQLVGLDFGKQITVDAELMLSGFLVAYAANTQGNTKADATVFVDVTGTGIAANTGGLAKETIYPTVTHINNPPPSTIPIHFTAVAGFPLLLSYTLTIEGNAHAASDLYLGRAHDAQVRFEGDYSHTLLWNGIKHVNDATTGQPLTGWTVASASGFDYSKPYVPEPTSALLAASAVLLSLTRRGSRLSFTDSKE